MPEGTLKHRTNESVAVEGTLVWENGGELKVRIDGTDTNITFYKSDGFVFVHDYVLPTEPGIYVDYKPGIRTEYLDVYYLRQDGWMNPRHGNDVLSSVIEAAFKRRKTDLRRLTLPTS